MNQYENVLKYKDYFEDLKQDDVVTWRKQGDQGGAYGLPFPDYHTKFKEFIREVKNSNLLHKDYINLLEDSEFDINDINQSIEEADFENLRAILTLLIRRERFGDGNWASSVESGDFYYVLVRLEELID
ncbi:DUF6508 domain-containing protein [Aquisalibacillus elongatus]|uniref:Uncharacterized protein n=1 Tax=Aquisalibacillus elongatus TaxID=485577 RepID=A0A3N5B4G0_9BACI|nr:DUF6508 domain-containing protein [Aquisalibacillus elongatus]RPF52203.1 hypothetical protein EDC24_2194 [Aquisalibacillus elongatus]